MRYKNTQEVSLRDSKIPHRVIAEVFNDKELTVSQKVRKLKRIPGTGFWDIDKEHKKIAARMAAEFEKDDPGYTERVRRIREVFGRISEVSEEIMEEIDDGEIRSRAVSKRRRYAVTYHTNRTADVIKSMINRGSRKL